MTARRATPIATRDRAAVVTAAIIQTIADALRNGTDAHAAIIATLRDEFADVARQTASEIRLLDD